jgi:signal transduction histidine kinase
VQGGPGGSEMQGAITVRGRRRHVRGRADHDVHVGAEYRGIRVAAATRCLAGLATAAIGSAAVEAVHPFHASLVSAVVDIGIALAALVGARVLHLRSRQEAEFRRSVTDAATTRERRRIARDLHDGLAQDLAFIAAHGDRLAFEMGAEHPLAIAARRALAVSRGAIAELSATQAPTLGEALRQVAEELGSRFQVQVEVHCEPLAALAVTASEREDIVRIAREAIVNSVRHGRATNVVVSLAAEEDRLVLRVRDNGIGISSEVRRSGDGFGFLSMRERATALGGRFTASAPSDGGTELELVVPS